MDKELLQQLDQYQTQYIEEKEQIELFRNFLIENGMEAFSRNLKKGHITASGWILDKSFHQVLLIHHKKLDKLIQPGGHCEEEDCNVKMTALREVKEELDLSEIEFMNDGIFNIDIHEIPERRLEERHFHYDICYLFTSSSNEPITQNEEAVFAKWYRIEELERMHIKDRALLSMIRKTKRLWNGDGEMI